MRIPTSVLIAAVLALLILALIAGSWRANAQSPPNGAGSANTAQGCLSRLVAGGVLAETSPQPAQSAGSTCGIMEPVRLLSVADPALASRRILFPEGPLLSCAMAERFARFAADMAAPLALGIYGKELASIRTGPGYECRPRNRQAGAKPSSHGKGDAVDIMSVDLHGGRKVVVENPDSAETIRFVAAVRAAACGVFTTVLGPGSDAAHRNHVHIDIGPRGRDGQSKFCQ